MASRLAGGPVRPPVSDSSEHFPSLGGGSAPPALQPSSGKGKQQQQGAVDEEDVPPVKAGKKKKGKRQVDPSLLGFSVESNRIMQGAIERAD
jgi:hypothetical protein